MENSQEMNRLCLLFTYLPGLRPDSLHHLIKRSKLGLARGCFKLLSTCSWSQEKTSDHISPLSHNSFLRLLPGCSPTHYPLIMISLTVAVQSSTLRECHSVLLSFIFIILSPHI